MTPIARSSLGSARYPERFVVHATDAADHAHGADQGQMLPRQDGADETHAAVVRCAAHRVRMRDHAAEARAHALDQHGVGGHVVGQMQAARPRLQRVQTMRGVAPRGGRVPSRRAMPRDG